MPFGEPRDRDVVAAMIGTMVHDSVRQWRSLRNPYMEHCAGRQDLLDDGPREILVYSRPLALLPKLGNVGSKEREA